MNPSIKRNLNMFLREICIYAAVKVGDEIVERFPSGFFTWFHRETICVTEMYTYLISRKVDTKNISKILVNFKNSEKGSSPKQTRPYMAALNVFEIEAGFSFKKYAGLSKNEKKRMILNTLQETLLWLARKESWDPYPFSRAYTIIQERNLECKLNWRDKGWPSPDNRFKAYILMDCGLREVSFLAILKDKKNNELARKHLGAAIPETGVLFSLFRKVIWHSSTKLRVYLNPIQFQLPDFWEVDFADQFRGKAVVG